MIPGDVATQRCAPALAVGPGDIVLRTADGTVGIGPAVTFDQGRAALASTPFALPYEPLGAAPTSPIVAHLDRGTPGLREPYAARPRDLVLGAQIDAPDGSRWNVGGTCGKDVSGYELRKLVFGGRGRLGRLRSVCLRLLPRPSASRLVRARVDAVSDATDLARRVHLEHLPFSYLGVVLDPDGGIEVVGRVELRGGDLAGYISSLERFGLVPQADDGPDAPWDDPSSAALVPAGVLIGVVGLPWRSVGRLEALARRGSAAYASVGHARVWYRAPAPASPRDVEGLRSHLDRRVSAAIAGV
jgi:glycolate oxidase